MSELEPASAWLLERFRAGDQQAANQLFERYFDRLVALVQGRLAVKLRRRIEADDVVMSAYRSFFVRVTDGQFELTESGDLWRLLAHITLHKLYREVSHHTAEKRTVDVEQSLPDELFALSREPSPDEVAAFNDELTGLMRALAPTERRTLELRLQGELIEGIATELNQSERTVRRTLARVREVLFQRLPPEAQKMFESQREATDTPSDRTGRPMSSRPTQPARTSTESAPPRRAVIDPAAPFPYTDFVLKEHIGEGITGKVYRAWQKSLERNVAVKHLRRSHLKRQELIARFCEEARLVARLRHPNIVAMHGLGRTPLGGYFLVMDWVPGPNLWRVLQQRQVAIAEAIGWVSDAARAIQHAHDRGVVHCDLKPSNLLLDADERVVLTDFGFARRLTHDTAQLIQGGTAAFMAPEQFDSTVGEIGPHTDVFGLGALLYTLVTGQPPRPERRVSDVIAAVLSFQPIRSPSDLRADVPDRLSELCLSCLSPIPSQRPESAKQFIACLHEGCAP